MGPSRLELGQKYFGSGLYVPWRDAYCYWLIFCDTSANLKHPNVGRGRDLHLSPQRRIVELKEWVASGQDYQNHHQGGSRRSRRSERKSWAARRWSPKRWRFETTPGSQALGTVIKSNFLKSESLLIVHFGPRMSIYSWTDRFSSRSDQELSSKLSSQ